MTRRQRDFSYDRSALQEALDRFADTPCKLSRAQVQSLLDELTGTFGMCLTPEDYETVQANAPTHPETFAELVAKLDGLGTGDDELFNPILRRVLATFEGASRGATGVLASEEGTLS